MASKSNLKKALKDSYNDYPEDLDETGIAPISENDANIILEIFDLFKKMKAEPQLLDILSVIKIYKDEDVLELIREYNKDYTGKDQGILFVDLGEFTFNVAGLYSIGRKNSYIKNKLVYCIMINESSNQNANVPYANRLVPFNSHEQREEELEAFKEKIKQHRSVLFL